MPLARRRTQCKRSRKHSELRVLVVHVACLNLDDLPSSWPAAGIVPSCTRTTLQPPQCVHMVRHSAPSRAHHQMAGTHLTSPSCSTVPGPGALPPAHEAPTWCSSCTRQHGPWPPLKCWHTECAAPNTEESLMTLHARLCPRSQRQLSSSCSWAHPNTAHILQTSRHEKKTPYRQLQTGLRMVKTNGKERWCCLTCSTTCHTCSAVRCAQQVWLGHIADIASCWCCRCWRRGNGA